MHRDIPPDSPADHPSQPPATRDRLAEERALWDERHRGGDFEGHGPNPTLVAAVQEFARGNALELASGSGTNAVWLATQGWQVTAVDLSPVGLANGRAAAARAGVNVDWLERDLQTWTPPARSFDLVAIVYFHLLPEDRRPVYAAGAAAVAPGGHLVIVAHDPSHAAEGQAGPPPERLVGAADLAAELVGADAELSVERAEIVRRTPELRGGPIDALVVLTRKGAPRHEPLGGSPSAPRTADQRRRGVAGAREARHPDAREASPSPPARITLPALGPRGEGWFAIQVLLLAAVALAALAGPDWSGILRVVALGVGAVLAAAGGLLALRGVLDLGGGLTVFPRPRPGSHLIESGAYALARHPIYGGLITGGFGWALLSASYPGLAAAVLLALFLALKSVREEAWLSAAFAGYDAYRRRTRRLIPWIL